VQLCFDADGVEIRLMWVAFRFLIVCIILGTNLYWQWSSSWFVAALTAIVLASLLKRLVYSALSTRAEAILRKDWLERS
jgi:membrane protein implicated in regulation of membrane protease activity